MLRANFPRNKERKRAEAKARQDASAELSPAQRLARLDEVFGEGRGAVKERLKLHARAQRGPALALHGPDTIEAPAEPRPGKPRRRDRDEKRGARS